MAISALDLFKIGVGPSSSHTMGPMRAGALFRGQLLTSVQPADVARIRIDLYGSLAATGLGHGTDRAVVAGVLGFEPQRVDPDLMRESVDAVVHGAAYGRAGEGTLRVSFGTGGDVLTRGLDRLAEGLRRL